jgi:hypothetical protein
MAAQHHFAALTYCWKNCRSGCLNS